LLFGRQLFLWCRGLRQLVLDSKHGLPAQKLGQSV
jgi:hypothetical protein